MTKEPTYANISRLHSFRWGFYGRNHQVVAPGVVSIEYSSFTIFKFGQALDFLGSSLHVIFKFGQCVLGRSLFAIFEFDKVDTKLFSFTVFEFGQANIESSSFTIFEFGQVDIELFSFAIFEFGMANFEFTFLVNVKLPLFTFCFAVFKFGQANIESSLFNIFKFGQIVGISFFSTPCSLFRSGQIAQVRLDRRYLSNEPIRT
ncbi:hypothetical protein M5K25_007904 [Dendrobium thyrsiflorum]|uniref:Uncharacterized protein n=1 Tax=Dendrobium thyrsiflorum TaxID=117978 RepID=A0ABD0V8E1_DENTH